VTLARDACSAHVTPVLCAPYSSMICKHRFWSIPHYESFASRINPARINPTLPKIQGHAQSRSPLRVGPAPAKSFSVHTATLYTGGWLLLSEWGLAPIGGIAVIPHDENALARYSADIRENHFLVYCIPCQRKRQRTDRQTLFILFFVIFLKFITRLYYVSIT